MLIEAEICGKTLPRTLHPKTTKKLEMATGLLAGTRRGGLSEGVNFSRPLVFLCMHPQPQIGIVSKLSDGRPRADLIPFARLAEKKETAEKNERHLCLERAGEKEE